MGTDFTEHQFSMGAGMWMQASWNCNQSAFDLKPLCAGCTVVYSMKWSRDTRRWWVCRPFPTTSPHFPQQLSQQNIWLQLQLSSAWCIGNFDYTGYPSWSYLTGRSSHILVPCHIVSLVVLEGKVHCQPHGQHFLLWWEVQCLKPNLQTLYPWCHLRSNTCA